MFNFIKSIIFTCIAGSLFFFVQQTHAAPIFCVKAPGVQPQCIYNDARQCIKKANRMSEGFCDINEDEVELPESSGYFCLVTSTRYIQCPYTSYKSCVQDIKSKNGICVASKKIPLENKQFENEIFDTF